MPNVKLTIEYTADDFKNDFDGGDYIILNNKIAKITYVRDAGEIKAEFMGGGYDDLRATFTFDTLDLLDARIVRFKPEVKQYIDNLLASVDDLVEVEIKY